MTETYISSTAAQIIGRVFTLDDAIHFVLGTDAETGMARCSRRTPEGPGIAYVPMADVKRLLTARFRQPAESEPAETDLDMIFKEAS